MMVPIGTEWRLRIVLAGCAAVLATAAIAPRSAEARVWLSFSAPYPAYYYPPGPYYGYAPAPYAYVPPPGYYPPADYTAPATYPPAGTPSAYVPPDYDPAAPSAYVPPDHAPTATANRTPTAQPSISYTNKPAFTNAAGQTCRQYKTTDTTKAHPVDVYGTACRQADGQWRVVD